MSLLHECYLMHWYCNNACKVFWALWCNRYIIWKAVSSCGRTAKHLRDHACFCDQRFACCSHAVLPVTSPSAQQRNICSRLSHTLLAQSLRTDRLAQDTWCCGDVWGDFFVANGTFLRQHKTVSMFEIQDKISQQTNSVPATLAFSGIRMNKCLVALHSYQQTLLNVKPAPPQPSLQRKNPCPFCACLSGLKPIQRQQCLQRQPSSRNNNMSGTPTTVCSNAA